MKIFSKNSVKIRDLILSDTSESPNLYVFLTYTNTGGVVGRAWVGSLCVSDNSKAYRSSINAYIFNDLISAEILAHEIGHNLNMRHDFLSISGTNKVPRICPTDDSSCTDINGIMDYYETSPLSWTCCSRFGILCDLVRI